MINKSAYTLEICADSWRELIIDRKVSSFIRSPRNLVQLIISRPASDFKALDLSRVYLKRSSDVDTGDVLNRLKKSVSQMQLVIFRDSIDLSLLGVLNPTKIEELRLDFGKTLIGFWFEFSRF